MHISLESLDKLTQTHIDLDTGESSGKEATYLTEELKYIISPDAEEPFGDSAPSHELPDDPVMPTGAVGMYLASLKKQLIREMELDPWPKCYKQGQFWIYPQDPYFFMHKGLQ